MIPFAEGAAGASPVSHQNHAQAVLALFLGADALGLRREEDLPGCPHLPHKV